MPELASLPPGIEIRRLARSDAPAWRELRLQALQAHPEAYGDSYEEAAKRDLAWFRENIPPPDSADAIFGVFHNGSLTGAAGFAVQKPAKLRHKGIMWGVYLEPALRGQGVGDALMHYLVRHARAHVAVLHAAVAVENAAARALYRRTGFVTYGREPRALRIDGRDLDEDLVAIELT